MPSVLQQAIDKYKHNPFTKYVIIIALIIFIYLGYRIYVWANTQSTDNAYIDADISNVSAEVSGVLTKLFVTDNTKVNKGDLIGEIDDRDYKAKLAALEASIEACIKNIEIIEQKISIGRSSLEQAAEKLKLNKISFDIVATDFMRVQELNKAKFASPKTLDDSKNAYQKAKTDYKQAQLDLDISKQHLQLLELEKAAEQEKLKELTENKKVTLRSLQNTKLIAMVPGIFGNSSLEVGNYIVPGRVLFSIVQDNTMYIQANFKETQIQKFKSGMKVKIEFDALPKKVIYGKIRNIAPATGSKFSLIPPDHATGNFTKSVQRVPVLIDFESPNANLVPGMSAIVSIRTDQST
ncbi:HlyD family secretion protein [Rickettsia rickettsii]|nr:HlyD family secretion protein [Rickettsia rickettsii]AFB22494.1 multidrug resistance protein A [Rickettsia rickettsii str. Brazil]AFB23270.1 multidrug resistance protein A [Rickettsia rickettsii str. Colombia]AFB24622.1 multidrug resistance protein A [Rickettsia rickettsii str. Arizona]AFB27308.1 multidrug resistance protein A [Rickettsia rickettsii str. Hino]AFB29965.1 multidrug resistance protein A [Rickettsia rickettsii str. Hauke]